MTFKGKEEIVQQTTKAMDFYLKKREREKYRRVSDGHYPILPVLCLVNIKWYHIRTANHISLVTLPSNFPLFCRTLDCDP